MNKNNPTVADEAAVATAVDNGSDGPETSKCACWSCKVQGHSNCFAAEAVATDALI